MNNNQSVYYSREDVSDAYWILSTQHSLEHGLYALLWATHVRIWVVGIVSYVKRKFTDLSKFDFNFLNTIRRIRRGELRFKDTP